MGKRGAAIIDARGLSSAASAANAAIDHVRDWVLGTQRQVGHDGHPVGRLLRHPRRHHLRRSRSPPPTASTRCVAGLEIDAFSRERMDLTLKELLEERDGVKRPAGKPSDDGRGKGGCFFCA